MVFIQGARLNEICQLHLKDIRQDKNGLYAFNFNADEEDKRLKTNSSSRIVPVHSKLIELGLITFSNQLMLQNETRLFPEIKRNSNGSYSDAPSKWFSRYRKINEVDDTKGRKSQAIEPK